MGEVHVAAQNELTRTIAERLREVWDAYAQVDAEMHSALLTKEYRAVHPAVHRPRQESSLRGEKGKDILGFREKAKETGKRSLWVS